MKVTTSLICGLLTAANIFAISSDEQADILFMKQEEKLARDVYNALYETHNIQVFANIAKSEQRHMDAVDYLIQTYGLQDSTPSEAGAYTYDELTNLYSELLAKGNESVINALEVGVTIETVDIEDLENALLTTEDVTIRNVFGNLLRASRNHLRAFENNLTGGTPNAQAPQIGFGKGAQGGTCVITGEPATGSQLQLQSKSGNGNGAWRGNRGNGQGTGAANGNAAVQNQNVNCDPENPTLIRARIANGDQVRYSNTLCTIMANTPWPNAEPLGQGWFATWMGDVHMGQYPTVYIERFGWITIESFGNGEVYWKDVDGNQFMTTEERYPAYLDMASGVWM